MSIDLDAFAATLAAPPVIADPLSALPASVLEGLREAMTAGPLGPHEKRYIGSVDCFTDAGPILAALNRVLEKHGLRASMAERLSSQQVFQVARI